MSEGYWEAAPAPPPLPKKRCGVCRLNIDTGSGKIKCLMDWKEISPEKEGCGDFKNFYYGVRGVIVDKEVP